MTRKRVYLIIQTILCVGLTVWFSLAAIRVYQDGMAVREAGDLLAPIYSREIVADRFAPIAPVFFGAIGLLAAGLILGIKDSREAKGAVSVEGIRHLLAVKGKEPTAQMQKEQSVQKKWLYGGWAGFGLCMIPVFIYVINPGHFSAVELEEMFYALILHILPWTALGLAWLLLCTSLKERSIRREISLGQEFLKQEKGKAAEKTEQDSGNQDAKTKKQSRIRFWIRIALLAAAVLMIILGALNGSLRDVLVKAINLCTECIGLG